MNKFIIVLLLLTNVVFSQLVIFNEPYSNLPFELNINNSGIYSVASFDINEDAISFSSFTKSGIFKYSNGMFSKKLVKQKIGADFVDGVEMQKTLLHKRSKGLSHKETILFKKNFLNGKSILRDIGGNISGADGEEITISVPNKNELIIKSNLKLNHS